MIYIFNDLTQKGKAIQYAYQSAGFETDYYRSPVELLDECEGDETMFFEYIACGSTFIVSDYELGAQARKSMPSFYLIEKVAQFQMAKGIPVVHAAVYSGYEQPPYSPRYAQLPKNALWFWSESHTPQMLVEATKHLVLPERQYSI